MTIDSSNGVVVIHDMSNDDYHNESDHISRSKAHRYRGSRGGRSQRFEEVEGRSLFTGNASTDFGSLVDAMFEAVCRGDYIGSVAAFPPPDVLTSNGQRRGKKYAEWRASLPPGQVEARAEDFERASDVIAAITEHEYAAELIRGTTQTQESVFWVDADGHKRKARNDGRYQNRHWYDLKTTSKDLEDLRHSFRRFGYGWQAAWYAEAAGLSGCDEPGKFPFIVATTNPPYDVAVVELTQESIDEARQEIRETLAAIRERRTSKVYLPPSYHQPITLDLCWR